MILRSLMFPSGSGSLRSTRAIVNKFSAASWESISIASLAGRSAVATSSGAMTAATLKTFLNISGSGGQMSQFSVRTADATARTITVKITVDGFVVSNSTSASIAASGDGGIWTGSSSASALYNPFPNICWRSTLLIEVASSLTETDKLVLEWIYNTEA